MIFYNVQIKDIPISQYYTYFLVLFHVVDLMTVDFEQDFFLNRFSPFLQTEELDFEDNFCFLFSSLLLFVCHKRNDLLPWWNVLKHINYLPLFDPEFLMFPGAGYDSLCWLCRPIPLLVYIPISRVWMKY